MHSGVRRGLVTVATAQTVVPGTAAAQPLDPVTIAEAPSVVWATASFALVLLFGGVLLYRDDGFVERSVDASLERPGVAVVYGLMAFGFLLFAGGYASSQLARLDSSGGALSMAALGVAGVAALVLAALGYLVLGTLVTDLQGSRRPWHGLVLGAGISAVGWLLLPLLGGLAAFVLLAAFGVGGPTRRWFHTPRRVEQASED
jgi:MFS family permease